MESPGVLVYFWISTIFTAYWAFVCRWAHLWITQRGPLQRKKMTRWNECLKVIQVIKWKLQTTRSKETYQKLKIKTVCSVHWNKYTCMFFFPTLMSKKQLILSSTTLNIYAYFLVIKCHFLALNLCMVQNHISSVLSREILILIEKISKSLNYFLKYQNKSLLMKEWLTKKIQIMAI